MNHQNTNHVIINKEASLNELRWKQQSGDNRGFPTRQAETQKREVQVAMQTKQKELKYDLAERMRSRKFKTLGYDSEDSKDNDKSYRQNIKMRKKKVILEEENSDPELDRTLRAVTNATRNNTIASTTNYLTAATGNRNTRIMRTGRSRISSRGSEED